MEPEAFGYCWHRSNGEFYYGVHLGRLDDGYIGSGTRFKNKFSGSKRSEWNRTIEIRDSYENVLLWESDVVNETLLKNTLCLNLQLGGRYGKHSEESIKKMSIAKIGKKLTGNHKNKISQAIKGRELTDTHKFNLSSNAKGRNMSKALAGRLEIVNCPHCDKSGSKSNMKRWHFDNCKILNKIT